VDHCFLNFPGNITSFCHSSFKFSFFSSFSHSFNVIHNRSLVNLVRRILDLNLFLLNVWMESKFFGIFLELDFLGGLVRSLLLLSLDQSKLVQIKTLVACAFLNAIRSLTFVFAFSFSLLSRFVVVYFWMECAVLTFFLLEFSFSFLNPLLLISGCSQDIKTSYLLSIVGISNSLSIVFCIFYCFLWNLGFESAIFCHILSCLFCSWLLSKPNESNSV